MPITYLLPGLYMRKRSETSWNAAFVDNNFVIGGVHVVRKTPVFAALLLMMLLLLLQLRLSATHCRDLAIGIRVVLGIAHIAFSRRISRRQMALESRHCGV